MSRGGGGGRHSIKYNAMRNLYLYQLAVQDKMVKRVKLAQLVKASACQGGIYSLNLILRINLWGDFSKVQAHNL